MFGPDGQLDRGKQQLQRQLRRREQRHFGERDRLDCTNYGKLHRYVHKRNGQYERQYLFERCGRLLRADGELDCRQQQLQRELHGW